MKIRFKAEVYLAAWCVKGEYVLCHEFVHDFFGIEFSGRKLIKVVMSDENFEDSQKFYVKFNKEDGIIWNVNSSSKGWNITFPLLDDKLKKFEVGSRPKAVYVGIKEEVKDAKKLKRRSH